MIRKPCACDKHRDGAPTALHGHRFECASDEVERQGMFLQRWRYVCSCGSRGRWTFQSDSVVYHSWLGHIRRTQAQRRLYETQEMYQ